MNFSGPGLRLYRPARSAPSDRLPGPYATVGKTEKPKSFTRRQLQRLAGERARAADDRTKSPRRRRATRPSHMRFGVGYARGPGRSTSARASLIGNLPHHRAVLASRSSSRTGLAPGGNIAAEAARAGGRRHAAAVQTGADKLDQLMTLYDKLSFDLLRDFAAAAAASYRVPSGDGRERLVSGEDRRRVHRLRQGQPGQDKLRLGRHRLGSACERASCSR